MSVIFVFFGVQNTWFANEFDQFYAINRVNDTTFETKLQLVRWPRARLLFAIDFSFIILCNCLAHLILTTLIFDLFYSIFSFLLHFFYAYYLSYWFFPTIYLGDRKKSPMKCKIWNHNNSDVNGTLAYIYHFSLHIYLVLIFSFLSVSFSQQNYIIWTTSGRLLHWALNII